MARYEKYETKSGQRWMYIVEGGINPQTGKRRRIVKRGFKREKDAKDAALEFEYQMNILNFEIKEDITFKDMADEWLSFYQTTEIKISTIRVRVHEIGHLNDYFALYKMKEITKTMYQNALNHLKNKKNLAYNTISGIHGTARMIFKRAREQDVLISDPTEFARIPKDRTTVEEIENTEVKELFLEKDELKLFLEKAKEMKQETYAILLVLSWTGLRVGELVALRWSDIDFIQKTMSITKTYYNPTNNSVKYTLLPPKTTSSIRKIIVEDEVIEVLLNQKNLINAVKEEVGDDYYDKNYVFGRMNPPYFGYPIFIKTVQNRMEAVLKQLPTITKHLTPHSLRHTHTSLMAEAGVDLFEIMDRLGHRDDETTTQVYLHITKEKQKKASQKFGQLMRSLSKPVNELK